MNATQLQRKSPLKQMLNSVHLAPENELGKENMSYLELQLTTPEYMHLPRLRFKFSLPEYRNDEELKNELLDLIVRKNMCGVYEEVCRQFGWQIDEDLRTAMSEARKVAWEKLEASKDVEDYSKDNWREKLELACEFGEYEQAKSIAEVILKDESNSSSTRAEAAFGLFRIAYLLLDARGMGKIIIAIAGLMENACNTGSNWCCRNKLKVYEAVNCLGTRNFSRAASLLLDCVPTFESYELLSFKDLIEYTVLAGMISLSRSELDRHFNGNGLLQQALITESPKYREYIYSLYDCHYADFFKSLGEVELDMKSNPLLYAHYRYYVREMRLKGYSQHLQAYRSLSLNRMALEFGVSEEYIEQEIARFIANGKLHCKIDKVSGAIVTVNTAGCEKPLAPDASCDRGEIYQKSVRKGDALLNRLQKLAQVIEF